MSTKLLLTFEGFNPLRLTRREVFDNFEQVIAFSKTDKMSSAELYVNVHDEAYVFHVGTVYPGGRVRYTSRWMALALAADAVAI